MKHLMIDIGNGFTLSMGGDTGHYCHKDKNVELAIFKDGEWYTEDTGIKSLDEHNDGGSETKVYGYVSAKILAELILKLGE